MSDAFSSPVNPSVGLGVVHLLLRARRGESAAPLIEAVEQFASDDQQVIAFSILGARADFGLIAVGPDLRALDGLTKRVLGGPVEAVDSYLSLTEESEYAATEEDERARLEAAGEQDIEAALETWRARIVEYRRHRVYPTLPDRPVVAFYPMSKTRQPGANWYELPFEERKRLMLGHGRVGRRYAGRIVQLITGSSGLDDWEWGVTLFAEDPAAVKEIVYEMRFDPVSATYGEFGPFWVGLRMPIDELAAHVGLA